MKRLFVVLSLLLALLPAAGLAQITIQSEALSDGTNQIVLFHAEAEEDGARSEEEQLALEMRLMMIDGAISMRMGQARAQQLYENAQRGGSLALHQSPRAYVEGNLASLAVVWEGIQPDGTQGCRPYTLALDLETGLEIPFSRLFEDMDGAIAAMEQIVQRDYLDDMNTYVEVADLLPIPTGAFSFDETGLTIYYDDSRFATFDGPGGYVTFYWHEIAEYIGESSPVYALSRPQQADADAIRSADGFFGDHRLLGLYEPLGKAMDAYGLTDEPDYTATSILYPADEPELRGLSVEIDKYAEMPAADTPICAVRHSRVSWHGLTTGVTTREEITGLLGEPEDTLIYSESAAYDALLEPGESLLYRCNAPAGPMVLEAHLNESGMLSCLILRDAMPETLY